MGLDSIMSWGSDYTKDQSVEQSLQRQLNELEKRLGKMEASVETIMHELMHRHDTEPAPAQWQDVTGECHVDDDSDVLIPLDGDSDRIVCRVTDGYRLRKVHLYREGAKADAAFIVEKRK